MANDDTELRQIDVTKTPPVVLKAAALPDIPGFTLGVRLGEGGMAVVYEAFDLGFTPPRRVAIKLMSSGISADLNFQARFSREASVVAEFRHDNVVHVYASGEASGTKYIVMEYLAGGTLADLIRTEPLPPRQALRIAAVLADALAYSHARGIVHRDFKPGNVLLTTERKPVLSDFGVAKDTSANAASLTQHSIVIGAPRYMAPEQLTGDAVSDRTDVYSWGLTLLELLVGKVPPHVERLHPANGIGAAHLPLPESVPAGVSVLISRCLRLDPSQRPSATECRDQLTLLNASPASVSAIDMRKFLNKLSGKVWYIAAGLAVLITAVTFLIWISRNYDAIPLGAATAQQFGAATAEEMLLLQLDRQPGAARVYVDGAEAAGAKINLTRGTHEIVAVARGFYGQARSFVLPDPTNATQRVQLQPVELPSVAEHERFVALADTKKIAAADIGDIREWTLATALQMKLLRENNQIESLNVLKAQLDTLARYGDQRAVVALLLAEGIRQDRFSRSLINERLIAASDNGDAMASFFMAVALRDELRDALTASSVSRDFRIYCDRVALAIKQGWTTVASQQWQQDKCDR